MRIPMWMSVVSFGTLLVVNAAAEEFNPVVGKAGDFVMREADLERLIGYQSPEAQKTLSDPSQRAGFVRQILLTKATAARAKKENFDRRPEVKEQLSFLVDNYLAQEYVRKAVLAQVAVPEKDVQAYYDSHKEEFVLSPEVTARHIFFQLPDEPSPEQKKLAREKAEQTLDKLKKGEDFGQLAGAVSEDTDTAAKGGSLGVISPGKTNSREFEDALFALKRGEISQVVETPFGFHLIKVEERKDQRTATFEEARPHIHNRLKAEAEQKRAREFLEEVAKENGIEVPADEQEVKQPAQTP